MRDPLPEGTSQIIDESPNNRLDSWKEIAAYFRRDVRTVRRWEQSLGLPVHRHRQRRGVAVYAYKAEVDEWWRRRDQIAEAAAPAAAPRWRLKPPVWAAIASLATLGILLGVLRDGSSDQPASITPVPVTSFPGIEDYPSLSPDGNRLAFSWNGAEGRNFDLYIKALDSSLADPVRLTEDPAPDVSPAWSPDGRSIAFVRQTAPGEMKVMMVPAVGGAEREVATAHVTWDREAGSYLAWTPDGKGLVFPDRERPEKPVGLSLLSLETGETRRLTEAPSGWWGDSSPAFSPDGRQLAFERLNTLAVSDIYVLRLTAEGAPRGELRRLTETEGGAMNPVWSGDGKSILFVADQGETARVQRVSTSGSGPVEDVAVDAMLPSFSLAASKLVYSRGSFDTNIWNFDVRSARSGADGGSSFIASTRNDSWADYCPDGENVVYLSDRSGTPELWISDAKGANSRQLSAFGGPRLAGPRWAPDGENIVFAVWEEGSADIYAIHGAGGAPTPVTADPAEDLAPSWSRDGRWIYFASNRSGDWQVWKTPAGGLGAGPSTQSGPATEDAEGVQAQQVTQNGGSAAMESPDGRFLYFTKGQGVTSLWKMPVEGGEETLLAENLFGAANFYVTDQGVYFISRSEHEAGEDSGSVAYSLEFLNLTTGKTNAVTAIEQPADLGLAMSPDGRQLLYAQWDQFEADLILQMLPE